MPPLTVKHILFFLMTIDALLVVNRETRDHAVTWNGVGQALSMETFHYFLSGGTCGILSGAESL